MVFNSFRIKVIFRILLLLGVFLAIVYFVSKPYYYFTTIELIVLAILLIIELIYFVEKGYRQLNNMLESVKEKDFNLTFSPVEQSKGFERLANLLNVITDSYRKVRIEKEVHYQFLNHIVDQVNQAMVCFDLQGKVTLSNRAAKNLLSTHNIFNVSSFSSVDPALPQILMSLREGQEKLMSFMKNGELHKYAASCTSLKLLDKKYKLVVLHDIRNTLQEQEHDSYRKLIRVLTHEIMNSVTPILSLSQAMSESLKNEENSFRPLGELSPQESADLIEGYHAIEIRSRALMRFVNDFKTLSKLPPPKLQNVEVEEMLRGLVTLQKSTIESKGIDLVMTLSPSINNIRADKDLIEQVLINLLKNAFDATQNVNQPRIEIDVFENNGTVFISVSDNGVGIPLDNFDKVFVPFFSTKLDGSGIGLSLSHEIMRLHGGTITVRSEQGKGATFTISLPI